MDRFVNKFNQDNKNQNNSEGEAVRLSNELRDRPEEIIKDIHGVIIKTVPKRNGFNIETASFELIADYLENNYLSKSLECFIHRVLSVRFPYEYKNYNVNEEFVKEKSLIESNSKNNIEWFGEVGYFGKTRLDKSIDQEIQGFQAKINHL